MDGSQWIGVRSPECRVTVGRAVFIGYQCMFTGHGAIDIAHGVMIANKVKFVTAGHPVEPDKRRAMSLQRPLWPVRQQLSSGIYSEAKPLT